MFYILRTFTYSLAKCEVYINEKSSRVVYVRFNFVSFLLASLYYFYIAFRLLYCISEQLAFRLLHWLLYCISEQIAFRLLHW